MIQLFLKKDATFQEVFPDFANNIKLTKENPYFTQSDSYTLEIILPMAVLKNRKFFDNLQRFDKSKNSESYDAMLIAENVTLMMGTAHIVGVTDNQVKIQLLGGNSEVAFLSNNGDKYIDEMDLGIVPVPPASDGVWDKGRKSGFSLYDAIVTNDTAPYVGIRSQFIYVPVYDEENNFIVNSGNFVTSWLSGNITNVIACEVPQMNLLYILRLIIEKFGYTLQLNELNEKPFNRIYIANTVVNKAQLVIGDEPREGRNLGCRIINKLLPHWTVKEFLEQIQNFFNVTIVFDSVEKKASAIKNAEYFVNSICELEAIDEFSVDVTEEDEESDIKTLASSNLEYDMSSSAEHYIDCMASDIEDIFEKRSYSSYDALLSAMASMEVDEKKKIIFCHDNNQWIYDDENDRILNINQFGRLYRNTDTDDTISLKICPVATTIHALSGMGQQGEQAQYYSNICMPSVNKPKVPIAETSTVSVWEAINGEENEVIDKEDRIEVFFMDEDRPLLWHVLNREGEDTGHDSYYMGGWTDKNLNTTVLTAHADWSLSLRSRATAVGIGNLHINGFSINNKAQYTVDCKTNKILDVNQIFIIKNRKFVCEKFEYTIDKNGLQPIAKGYFYELL